MVCELEIRVRNSVDRGEGIRHPSSPVVLARSLLLTYAYLKSFVDILFSGHDLFAFFIVELLFSFKSDA